MPVFSPFLGIGALLGLLFVGWEAPRKEILRYVDVALWTLFIALLGSRLLYVAVNWGYYQAHLIEILQVWRGGLSAIGALIGSIFAILILTPLWKGRAAILVDTLLPLGGTLAVASWMGCWVDGCGYGSPSGSWWALPSRDEWGVVVNRVPVQVIGAILTLALMFIIYRSATFFPAQGMPASLGLFAVSAVIFLLSYLRIDPIPIWKGLRLEAWGALGVMVFSGLLLVVLLVRWKFGNRTTRGAGRK